MRHHSREPADTTTNDEQGPAHPNADGGSEAAYDARVYRVLGEQFLEPPEEDRVEAVATWAEEWRTTTESLPPAVAAALTRIVEGASDVEALTTEFTRLFRGISEESSPSPPYESLYVDDQFYSDTTTEIRQGYRWAGVDVDGSQANELPDHLGIELQFLGELLEMDAQGRGPEDRDTEDAIRWMLDDHLREWLPVYRDRISEADPPDYYAGLIDLAFAVVDGHEQQLQPSQG